MADYDLWDSPLTGAYLLWRFTMAFEEKATVGPNLLLAFPALLILITPKLAAPLSKREVTSLSEYMFQFIREDSATLASLHGLIDMKRELVRLSLCVGFASSLLHVNKDGTLHANPRPEPRKYARIFRENYDKKAQRLGTILASVPPEKISHYLGVNF